MNFEKLFLSIDHIVVDSREDCHSALFVPIRGEKVDGHRFIPMAIDHGAKEIFTEEDFSDLENLYPDVHFYKVENTLTALQDFGAYCRRRYKGKLIGVTGSVGKTTTREMIATALSSEKTVFQTKGNANSQIGVPITLFHMAKEEKEISVIEMGVSLPGEMERLAGMASVDMAVFTNIGTAHLENMQTKENTCFEKMHILMGEKRTVSLYLPKKDPLLSTLDEKKIYAMGFLGKIPINGGSVTEEMSAGEHGIGLKLFFYEKADIPLSVPGDHMQENAGIALLLSKELHVSEEAAKNALFTFTGLPGRGEKILSKRGITILDDSYNASPDSMKASLRVLSAEKSSRRIAVLGDMNELGKDELHLHREIGEELRTLSVDALFTLGEKSKEIWKGLGEKKIPGESFTSLSALAEAVKATVKEGDTVLFKASHSLSLSKVIDELLEEE